MKWARDFSAQNVKCRLLQGTALCLFKSWKRWKILTLNWSSEINYPYLLRAIFRIVWTKGIEKNENMASLWKEFYHCPWFHRKTIGWSKNVARFLHSLVDRVFFKQSCTCLNFNCCVGIGASIYNAHAKVLLLTWVACSNATQHNFVNMIQVYI